jgi:UDP-N-acetylmuramoyl-L-alanyl-D-glutamate--2,6-diaminopimelate ligase
MRLDQVISGAPPGARAVEITGLAYDNRDVTTGTLFFCVPGFTRDGHEFAAEAVANGAAALVVERRLDLGVPEVLVPSARRAMAPAAAAFNDDPTASLTVAGVTGTNGKTTTTFLLRALLEAGGRQTGLLGTVTTIVGGREREVERTTPEAIDLQRTFREMLDCGDSACAMEVSSHALELHRADAIHFDVAIFTNLTQDHLDFHPTMEDYFNAKRRLFAVQGATSVVNVDDEYGMRLASELHDPITYSLDHQATYRATHVETGLSGSSFVLHGPGDEIELNSPLRGRFNVYNVLAAVAAARVLGISTEQVTRAVPTAGQVPGRFQPVDEGQDFAVLVDYAHTPDSLENVLAAARAMAGAHQVYVVFGCGGDRDRGKRPLMGAIAKRLADRVVVTSDNPRSEDPEAIIDEIVAGGGKDVEREVDRRLAIEQAIAGASAGDIVVIAGKGHEQGQEFAAGQKIPFDDVSVAREVLRGAQPAAL